MLIDKYQLFIYTIDDLRKRIRANNYYSILRGCGLCRQLLIDEQPLVFGLDKKYHQDMRFKIPDFPEDDWMLNVTKTPFPLAWVSIYPSKELFKKKKLVRLHDFLATHLLKFNQHLFTVKDVIKAGANIMGGIHIGKAKNDKEKHFLLLDKAFKHDEKMAFLALVAICKVVLESMKPMVKRVKKEHRPAGGFSIK